MPLDWFGKIDSSETVADLVANKKYAKALEKLRDEFEKGNRSVGLRRQYADVLARSGQTNLAIPILLGLASELLAAGAEGRARELLQEAERLGPGRSDVAEKLRSFETKARRRAAPEEEADGEAAPPHDASAEFERREIPAQGRPGETGGEIAAGAADAGALPPIQLEPGVAENDAVDLFRPALAAPSLDTPTPSPAQVQAALAHAEAIVASEIWVEAEGEAAPEVLLAEVTSEPSIADVAEIGVAEGHDGKGSLVTYIRELAARRPVPGDARPGPLHFAAALFEDLPDDELRGQLPGLRRRDFDPGALMVSEGEAGERLFILARGRGRVLVTGAHGRAFEVAEIPEGSFFGEISMVGGRRTASVEALGPCETLEVASTVIEALAPGRPLVQQIVEETLLERAGRAEVEAVRAIPAMDEGMPARALALVDAHFGLPTWSPKMRLRLAELLAHFGRYVDAVPVLVGLADQMQAAGQPARALAVLGKITGLGGRSFSDRPLAPLGREPVAPRPSAPPATLTYASEGRPAPPQEAAQQFRRWLQELMAEAREEEPDAPKPPQATAARRAKAPAPA